MVLYAFHAQFSVLLFHVLLHFWLIMGRYDFAGENVAYCTNV
jgi:hypothetical protein